jgi:hypothetical protein
VRELTKSMMSYTWAISVFGVQQMVNLIAPGQGGDQNGKTSEALNNVTQATADTFDNTLKAAFRAGDNFQSGMVDLMFGGLLSGGCEPSRWMRMGADAMKQMTDLGMRVAQSTANAGRGAAQTTGNPAGGGESEGPGMPRNGWGPMPR